MYRTIRREIETYNRPATERDCDHCSDMSDYILEYSDGSHEEVCSACYPEEYLTDPYQTDCSDW